MQTEKITALHADHQIQILSGSIESIDEQGYRIVSEAGHFSASRAFSCLVEPEVADHVLFSYSSHHSHILSVIERPGSNETQLLFPGDVSLKTAQGQMNFHAGQDLTLSAQHKISQLSEDYALMANKGLVSIDNLTALGSKWVGQISVIQTIADTLETVATHLLQKVKDSFRHIDGVDQTKARDVICTVKNLYSQRSKQSAILAKKDIKIDAERIHMG